MQPNPPTSRSSSVVKRYFAIAAVLLYVLALVWSIDASFVYGLIGVIAIFTFLGFTKGEFFNKGEASPKENSFNTKTVNTPWRKETAFRPASPLVPRATISKPMIVSVVAGLFLTVIILVIVIISNDSNDDEAAFEIQQAEYFYNQGEYDSAKIFYRQAISSYPESKEALMGYGNTLLVQEQYDSAIILYDKVLSIDPAYSDAAYQKGAAFSYQKNYDRSISQLQSLLQTNSSYFDALQLIGDNYYNQQKYDSALRWYDDAYKHGVRNRYLCHLMGYIHETKGNNNKAVKLYEEALGYDSSVLDIYQRLGELLPGEKGNLYRRKAAKLEQTERQ